MMSPFQYLPYNMAYVRARVRACVCACTVEIELGMLCAAGFIDMYAFRHAYGLPYKMVTFIAKKGLAVQGRSIEQRSLRLC